MCCVVSSNFRRSCAGGKGTKAAVPVSCAASEVRKERDRVVSQAVSSAGMLLSVRRIRRHCLKLPFVVPRDRLTSTKNRQLVSKT